MFVLLAADRAQLPIYVVLWVMQKHLQCLEGRLLGLYHAFGHQVDILCQVDREVGQAERRKAIFFRLPCI